ncbi:MAG: MoaD/ThiS family protein [Chthoniobacterales bacterium]
MNNSKKPISITLNGERRLVTASSLIEFFEELAMPLSTLLIEHNGVALHRCEIEVARLSAGDRIEILKVVAGG